MQIMNLVFQSSPNNMPDSLKLLVAIASFYPWTLAHPQTPTLARPNPKRHKSPFEPQIPEPWCTKTCPCFVCDGVCGGEARLDLGLKKPESSHFSSPPPPFASDLFLNSELCCCVVLIVFYPSWPCQSLALSLIDFVSLVLPGLWTRRCYTYRHGFSSCSAPGNHSFTVPLTERLLIPTRHIISEI